MNYNSGGEYNNIFVSFRFIKLQIDIGVEIGIFRNRGKLEN